MLTLTALIIIAVANAESNGMDISAAKQDDARLIWKNAHTNFSVGDTAPPVLSPTGTSLYLYRDESVVSLRTADGSQLWKSARLPGGGGQLVLSQDASTIFTTTKQFLHALSAADGLHLWNFTVGSIIGDPMISQDAGGLVFCCDEGGVWGIDAATGVYKLRSVAAVTGVHQCRLSVDGKFIYAASAQTLVALSVTDLSMVWLNDLSPTYPIRSTVIRPSADGSVIYSAISTAGPPGGSGGCQVIAMNAADGKNATWEPPLFNEICHTVSSSRGTREVIVGTESAVVALNGTDASVLWSHSTTNRPSPYDGDGEVLTSAVFSHDLAALFIGSEIDTRSAKGARLSALKTSDGSSIWEYTMEDKEWAGCSAPVLSHDGTVLYVNTGPSMLALKAN